MSMALFRKPKRMGATANEPYAWNRGWVSVAQHRVKRNGHLPSTWEMGD